METLGRVPDLAYHRVRFTHDPRREVLWRSLCRYYFDHLVAPADCVLELGCGYGHFINNIKCGKKMAIDEYPEVLTYLAPGIVARIGKVTNLDFVPDRSVDFVFASNLFEHLNQADFATTLGEIKRTLNPRGTLNILQPNYRLAFKEYFDDYTHVSVYSDISLCDFLSANGFQILERRPGFLPLTVKSRWPVSPVLIKLYLTSPVKPFAKQMFIRAVVG